MDSTRIDFRLLLEQLPAIVWATDRELRFVYARGAGLIALGLGADEVVGLCLEEYLGRDYDHLLLSLRRARAAMEARDTELQGECLEKSRNVLTELLVTLDRERGGEVAANLAALYSFLLGELVQVGVRADLGRLDRVTHMLGELRDAFAQVSSTAAVAASHSA